MESWPRVCSGIAAVALFVSGGARFALLRLAPRQMRKSEGLLFWGWRAGALLGVVGLLFSVVLRGTAGALLSGVAGRAALVALLAGLLHVGFDLAGQQSAGWPGLIFVAIIAGISAGHSPVRDSTAPLLLLGALVTAGLGLWAAGQGLDAPPQGQGTGRWASSVTLAALTLTVAAAAAMNWQVWGTPGGVDTAPAAVRDGFLNLLAVWFFHAASLVLGRKSARLTFLLQPVGAALLVGISLTVQWTLPPR